MQKMSDFIDRRSEIFPDFSYRNIRCEDDESFEETSRNSRLEYRDEYPLDQCTQSFYEATINKPSLFSKIRILHIPDNDATKRRPFTQKSNNHTTTFQNVDECIDEIKDKKGHALVIVDVEINAESLQRLINCEGIGLVICTGIENPKFILGISNLQKKTQFCDDVKHKLDAFDRVASSSCELDGGCLEKVPDFEILSNETIVCLLHRVIVEIFPEDEHALKRWKDYICDIVRDGAKQKEMLSDTEKLADGKDLASRLQKLSCRFDQLLRISLVLRRILITPKLSFYIRNLYKELDNYNENDKTLNVSSYTIYRGKHTDKCELQYLQHALNRHVITIGFICATCSEEVAHSFLYTDCHNIDHVNLMYEITIDLSGSIKNYCAFNRSSSMKDEFEFMILYGSLFRVREIRKDKEHANTWIIQLIQGRKEEEIEQENFDQHIDQPTKEMFELLFDLIKLYGGAEDVAYFLDTVVIDYQKSSTKPKHCPVSKTIAKDHLITNASSTSVSAISVCDACSTAARRPHFDVSHATEVSRKFSKSNAVAID